MKALVKICIFLVGALFIFSGFVKADDPLGFSYKLQEYFEAFGPAWKWAIPFSFPLACFIPVLEMILGFMALIGSFKKFTLWMLFLMDLFFTFLTFYTAHYNKVLECGCFGDAISMTPWVTFWKDVVILIIIGIIALGNKHYTPVLPKMVQNGALVIFILGSASFSWYCYNYLPVIDFRPYKVGTDIKKDMKGIDDVVKYHYTLINKQTKEKKEFDKFPDNYQATWDFDTSGTRTEILKKGIPAKIFDFNIVSLDGNDYTDSVLSNPNYNLLLVSSTITDANTSPETIKKINDLYAECVKNHIKFMCLTASGEGDINTYKQKNHAEYPFLNTDDTQLRTMIRSNPGLVMLKAGIVIAMWHYHSIPDYKSLNEQYFKK
jgi:hypothetical protein